MNNEKEFYTNGDKIRDMSNEELAYFLDNFNPCSRCRKNGNNCFPNLNIEEWLNKEYNSNEVKK